MRRHAGMRPPWLQVYTKGQVDKGRTDIKSWGNNDDVINDGFQFNVFSTTCEQMMPLRESILVNSADPFSLSITGAMLSSHSRCRLR